ncbi:uncharacterized protein LOC143294069 [Babylonia areolata]|uniref:uncharacterized protein LOC143294069 n=1 Tax=Babylonia areolata TaxID=304850 RepID=UPI003FD4B3C7
MQLLRMAMQKDQERDANANNVCHANNNQDQASQPLPDHCHVSVSRQSPSPGDTSSTSPFHVLLQVPCSDLPQTVDQGSTSAPSPDVSSRSGLNVSVNHSSQSSVLCNHEFCHTASLTMDVESSASPDVNCNILPPCLKASKPLCAPDNRSWNPLLSEHDASSGISRGASSELCVPGRKLPVGSMASGRVHDGRLFETEDCAEVEQFVTEIKSWAASASVSTRRDFEDGSKRSAGEETSVVDRGALHQSYARVNDAQVCETQSHPCQNERDSPRVIAGNDKNSKYFSFRFSAYHQGQTLQAELNLRNSVDMDVEDSENDEEPNRPCASKSFTPYIPQTAGDMGLAGRDQPPTSMNASSDTLYKRPSVKVNPVPVIVKPSVMIPSLQNNPESTSLQMSPPIWTTLALHSAVKNDSPQTPRETEQQVLPTANAHAQCISESLLSQETEAMLQTLNHSSISLSPNRERPDRSPKRVSRFKNHSHGASTAFRASPSKRSPLRSTLSHRHGRVASLASSALKNPDLFLEALLEDECALYAGRLQSFFRDKKTRCDRQDPPDPVARILNEGDDMHFIPVCDDSTVATEQHPNKIQSLSPTRKPRKLW